MGTESRDQPERSVELARHKATRVSGEFSGGVVVDIHEASGVSVQLSPKFADGKVAKAFFEMICEEAGGEHWSEEFICFPDETGTYASLVLHTGSGSLDSWLLAVTDPDSQLVPQERKYVTAEADDIAFAEQLIGRLLVSPMTSRLDKAQPVTYQLLPGVAVRDFDSELVNIFDSSLLKSPHLGDSDTTESLDNDPLLQQIFDQSQYIIGGQSQQHAVSRSTLAIIDAGLQIARQTDLTTISLAGLLAQIYDAEQIGQCAEVFDTTDSQSESGFNLARIFKLGGVMGDQPEIDVKQLLIKVVNTWEQEMQVEPDVVFEGSNIFELLRLRVINLNALVAEYGHVNEVIRLDRVTSRALTTVIEQSLVPQHVTGADMLRDMNEADRRNIETHTRLISDAVASLPDVNLPINTVIQYLIDRGIVSHELATVHADTFVPLIDAYVQLARSKYLMEASGVDASAIKMTMEAQLTEFLVVNADALRRTQLLGPEVDVNFDKLLDIIEATKLKGRSVETIARIIGRVVMAEKRVLRSTFPTLIGAVRQTVEERFGIELMNPPSAYDNDSGAALYVATEDRAKEIADYVRGILKAAGIDDRVVPVKVGKAGHPEVKTAFGVTIGDDSLWASIPVADRLPLGPHYLRHTRD